MQYHSNTFKCKDIYIIILIFTNERDHKQLFQIFVRSPELLSNVRWLHLPVVYKLFYSPNTSPLQTIKCIHILSFLINKNFIKI